MQRSSSREGAAATRLLLAASLALCHAPSFASSSSSSPSRPLDSPRATLSPLAARVPRGPSAAGHGAPTLRLRGGAFWFSATAGEAEHEAFFRQISTAPAAWIRDNLQKMCPFGAKEAKALKDSNHGRGRLRGGGQAQSRPAGGGAAEGQQQRPPEQTQGDDGIPFAQPGDVVAVTGASGYVAGHVIRRLVEKGYAVRGTVRALNDTAKVGHLKEQFPSLVLYEADLLRQGSFSECFEGCKFVIHTASPFKCPPLHAPLLLPKASPRGRGRRALY